MNVRGGKGDFDFVSGEKGRGFRIGLAPAVDEVNAREVHSALTTGGCCLATSVVHVNRSGAAPG